MVINLLRGILGLLSNLGLFAIIALLLAVNKFSADLPDYQQLKELPSAARHARPGERRPPAGGVCDREAGLRADQRDSRCWSSDAFLSAEDKTFYTHPGIDLPGIARGDADQHQELRHGTAADRRLDHHPAGGEELPAEATRSRSTRKVKEAILAFRIEQAFTKDRILELYLNEIYLGSGSYGVAAAALNYFDKPLDELTIAEAAYPCRPAQGAQQLSIRSRCIRRRPRRGATG